MKYAVRSRRFSLSTSAVVWLAGALLAGIAGVDCSSSSGGGAAEASSCLANPAQCPAGQTCWPTSPSTFACLASNASAGVGDSCVEKYNDATCADGLLCDSTNPDGTGQCAQYCGAQTACPMGYACHTTAVGSAGVPVDICRPAAPTSPIMNDAGPPETYEEGGSLPDIEFSIPDVVVETGPAQQ